MRFRRNILSKVSKEVKEDEMDRVCSINVENILYWWESQKERNHYEDQGVG
jgi:hypothetical protein